MDPHDPAATPPREDERVSHYLLLGRLGAGGMGEVYRARDEVLHREVAVKLLPRELATDDAARARLLREARLASALSHPAVCTVHDAGEHEGRIFLVMELVPGRSLEDLIVPGGMSSEAAARLGMQIADGLAHAHTRGVIHRDLKPANVMVTPDGRAKILDFGVSRRLDPEDGAPPITTLTQTGMMVGTLGYLPPEVLHGSRADARGDLWAFGVLMHRLLTGEAPFEGATGYELTASILNDPPRALPPQVPAGLRHAIARCLEKEPVRRPGSAAEVRDALASTVPGSARGRGPIATRLPAIAATVLAAVIVAALFVTRPWGGGPARATEIRSIAVLPLANLSSDASQEYFADGMTEELIQALSRISALSVISRTSVLGYKGTRKPPRDIGRELGVNGLIEGTVRRGNDRVSVAVSLIEAHTGRALWSQDYERPMADVLALQNDVAQEVVQEIAVTLTPGERGRLERRVTVDPRAYDAYLRGREESYRVTAEGQRASLAHFDEALRIAPGFAPAHAARGMRYYGLSNWFWAPDSAMRMARAEASRALALDPSLAEAHTLLGNVSAQYDWAFERAEREYRLATSLDPNSAQAHQWYGHYLIQLGRFTEAQQELDRALRIDPLGDDTEWFACWPTFYQGRYDSTILRLQHVLERDPNNWPAYGLLGETREMQGDYPGALAELEKARADGNPWIQCAIARVHAKQGRSDETRRELAGLDSASSRHAYVTPYGLASVYAALGEHDRAFELLDRGILDRSEDMLLLGVDPRMASLRKDPRFDAILRRLGLPRSGPVALRVAQPAQPIQRSPYANVADGSSAARIRARSAATPD
ncbi:MAG: protein kinase [Candidatus Eisenbacteria bacterium]